MSLLNEIFPGITDSLDSTLPKWNGEWPWSILDGDNGLIGQLSEMYGAEGVFIHPEAKIGDFVRIEGPCFIGAGAEIRHSAYLRKGSWVCEGSVVGHSSEIKNSLLLPNSKAPHFNYVGDSIIGIGVNLGAGVKVSNVRNDKGEVLVSLRDGTRVKTGLNKMGALVGDYCQLGCNSVINPGAILPPKSMIPPNNSITGWFDPKS